MVRSRTAWKLRSPRIGHKVRRLGGGELGHGLGSLGHGVLGELSGQHEADGGLDLAGREGRLLVVGGELSGLPGDALEDVVDEGVHDAHSLLADTGVGVDLLEHLVDVRRVGLDALLALLLVGRLDLLGGLGGSLLGWSLRHGWIVVLDVQKICDGLTVLTVGRIARREAYALGYTPALTTVILYVNAYREFDRRCPRICT